MRPVKIIRIDPTRRTIAAMTLRPAKEATPQIRQIVRAKIVGQRQIMDIEEKPLMVIAAHDVDEAIAKWRFPGAEDSAGVCVLTGRHLETNALIAPPVDTDWVRRRIMWIDGETDQDREGRAAEILPLLDDKVSAAIRAGFIVTTGEVWLSAAHKDEVGAALITLGLGTEQSGGQMLTRLGETVHEKLLESRP